MNEDEILGKYFRAKEQAEKLAAERRILLAKMSRELADVAGTTSGYLAYQVDIDGLRRQVDQIETLTQEMYEAVTEANTHAASSGRPKLQVPGMTQ